MTGAHVKLASDLMQRRDDYKRLCGLLGREYDKHISEIRAIIRGVAAGDGTQITQAALKVARRMSDAGHDPSMVFAALVEECEAVDAVMEAEA